MIEISVSDIIKVGCFDIAVLEDSKGEVKAKSVYGDFSSLFMRIRIDGDLLPQQLSSAFLHELIHAIDWVYCGDRLDETQASGLAHGLTQVLEQLGIRFVLKEGE